MDILVVLNAWEISSFKSIENPECIIEIGIEIPWFKMRGSFHLLLGRFSITVCLKKPNCSENKT